MATHCAKSAGLLCACLTSGVITSVREIFGRKSLSQRYLFVSALVAVYPELEAVVHDDACHLHKFTAARATNSVHVRRIAPPNVHYIGDIFHMAGHTDPWCLANCSPYCPHLLPFVEGFRASVCEFTFTWFSQYKHQSKHMREFGLKFFLQEMAIAHNRCIVAGDHAHLTHRGPAFA